MTLTLNETFKEADTIYKNLARKVWDTLPKDTRKVRDFEPYEAIGLWECYSQQVRAVLLEEPQDAECLEALRAKLESLGYKDKQNSVFAYSLLLRQLKVEAN